MTEMIEVIRAENPNGLRVGNEESGYTSLSSAEYEETLTQWAAARLQKQAEQAEALALNNAKIEAANKLIALGIDPKVFGLQVAE